MNDKLPAISVITVTYNVAKEIESTILSVINQSYNNIEYIIIDGGSTDGTVDIIKKYADSIAYWVSEPDKGIYDAMNKGITHAAGDWIINMNAGDRLLEIPVEQLKNAMNDEFIAVCGKILSEEERITVPRYDWMMKLRNTLPHQALFYRREYIQLYDLRYKIVADYNLNLGIYLSGGKILLIDNVVAFHSYLGISSNKQSALESFKVIKERCGIFYYMFSFTYRKYRAILFYIRKRKL